MKNLSIDIQKKSLCALAEASALAISDHSDTCLAAGIVYAGVSSSCPKH
jgi:hypothetical protein